MHRCHRPATTTLRIPLSLGLLILLAGGCARIPSLVGLKDSNESPRIRMSSYASSSIGTVFLDPDNLGSHQYYNGSKERNGILYACRAGHIDTPHVRKAADWTAYLARKARKTLEKGETEFSFRLYEPSRYFVQFHYPDNWKDLPQNEKDRIAESISIKVGAYCAYNALNWHEILTWFGYKPAPWYPEFPSAFSWEDTFSNVLGVNLAVGALQDTEHPYDQAMTLAFDRELKRLDAQPMETAKQAAELVRGRWYSGAFLFMVKMNKRHLDTGLDDGMVTPWLVEGLDECAGAEPQSYPAPNLDGLSELGFAVRFEIEPREWERGKILRIVYPDRQHKPKRIEPGIHFRPIMEYIRQDTLRRYGPGSDKP